MKSPLFQQQYSNVLNISAVYETRKSKTPSAYLQVNNGEAELHKKIQHNRSFVLDKQLQKKQFGNLRNTIGSPNSFKGANSKKHLDNFLRNTSQLNLKNSNFDEKSPIKNETHSYEPNSSQVNTSNTLKRQHLDLKETHRNFENKEDSYNKIMQKYDKKQKLLKQLKKLSEIKISQKNQSTYEYEKTGNQTTDKGNQLYTDRIMINISSPKPPSDNSSKRIDLNKSTVNDAKRNEMSKNYIKQKIINKTISGKPIQAKNSEKNPQEIPRKMSYFTPKVNKDNDFTKIEQRYTPTVNTSKDIINKSYLNITDVRTVNTTSLSKEIYSLTIPAKIKQTAFKPKTMSDIRETLDSSKHRSSINLLSNKKLSINDFQLGKSLGEGKFGMVYLAVHKETKFLVALKKITKQSIKSNYMIEQFLLEVKIQSFCEHENILKLYGCFDDKEHIYLVLEYMEEGTLFKQLKQKKTLNESQAAMRLRQVAQAIKYLHEKGIAHRDIKPQNIVISYGVGKLCDFGWAAICNQRRKTYCGTFDYAAPEILEGEQYDMSVDLWCLGVLAYELMVGRAPFYHISRKQTMKKILNVQSTSVEFPSTMSKHAVSFVDNLIRKRPQERMTAENVLRHPFLLQME